MQLPPQDRGLGPAGGHSRQPRGCGSEEGGELRFLLALVSVSLSNSGLMKEGVAAWHVQLTTCASYGLIWAARYIGSDLHGFGNFLSVGARAACHWEHENCL